MSGDELTARTTALKSSAIRQAVLKRNPFLACERIEIQNENFGRSLRDRIVARHEFQTAVYATEVCLTVIAQIIGAAVGLIAGLAVAVVLLMISLAVAGALLSADSSFSGGIFLFNQSWRHYAGWALGGVTAFFCPYLLLGIPTDLSLRFFWPIHGLFAAKKTLREIQCDSGNNDPAARVPVEVPRHHLSMKNGPFFQLVKVVWLVISRITVLSSGIGALACFAILYLKLGAMIFKQDVLLAAGIGFLMLCGLSFPYAFLHSRMGTRAVDHLISSLFHGEPYGEALREALASIGED
jgi:hypothetical protein